MEDTLKTTSNNIIKYLTQDLDQNEKQSYNEYIKGNKKSVDWIEKSLQRREVLILKNIQCNKQMKEKICKSWVNIDEEGICKCNEGHINNKQVVNIINKLP